jgi:hypothetical protein
VHNVISARVPSLKNTHLRQPHSTPGFAKPPSFWGGVGYYFGFTISLRLCPLAFASVSRCFKALFTTQHRHQPVVYLATRHSKFYASY